MKQNIWIVSELFYPDQTSTAYIMTEIAGFLAMDDQVNVICADRGYQGNDADPASQMNPAVKITRVGIGAWNKNKLFSRIIRLLIVTAKIGLRLYKNIRTGDKVVLVTNPAPLLLLASRICKWKKVLLVIIVHDIFPENLHAAGILSDKNFIYKVLRFFFNKAYAGADKLLVLGRDMRELILKKIHSEKHLPEMAIIANWADTDNVYPVEKGSAGPIKLQFAGNMGRVQGLIPLLDAINKANNANIVVEFVGSGAMVGKMNQFIIDQQMMNVRILPAFNRSRQQAVLNDCDIGIVSLASGMTGLGVPSKTYNILAAGKPILYIGDDESEISLLVKEHGIGWGFSDYGEDLVAFLRNLRPDSRESLAKIGQKARDIAVSRYSKNAILTAYKKAIISA